MITENVKKLILAHGVSSCGVVSLGDLPQLSERNKQRLRARIENPQTVLALLFPYFAGEQPGNISYYARGTDYHIVLNDRLCKISAGLKAVFPNNAFVPFADISPINEVAAAVQSGAALRGKNGLAICPEHGSYVFVGIIITDMEFDGKPQVKDCDRCGKCLDACPTGALAAKKPELCLSAITQKKSELSPEEISHMRNCNTAWGCDICQQVCPHNKSPKLTETAEFRADLICSLTREILDNTSLENRAFTWRGKQVLYRNLEILEK